MTSMRFASGSLGALFFVLMAGCSSFGTGDDASIAAPTREAAPTDPAAAADAPPDQAPAATPLDGGPGTSAPPVPPATGTGTPPATAGGCTSVTRTPSIIDDEATGSSDRPWLDTSDARTVDGQGASVQFYSSNSVSSHLYARDFGLGIPAGATIKGITLQIKRSATGAQVKDLVLFLVDLGAPGTGLKGTAVQTQYTDDYSKQGYWPTGGYTTATYGSATNMWDTTLAPAELNAPSFGVYLVISNWTAGGATARIDAITLTVNYCN